MSLVGVSKKSLKTQTFRKSDGLRERAHQIIPGGAHTYAKGDDQYPEQSPGFIERGEGCHVWDVDGNEFIEYGMGLRSVTLGHAYRPVIEAAWAQMQKGANFTRPSVIEAQVAESVLQMYPSAEMVKFAKNGSDVTSAVVRLARSYTGRDMVAICGDHPFFSVDDWFIGTTPMNSGIPEAIRKLTVKFRYNDIDSLRAVFEANPGRIACVMMEAETTVPPLPGFLQQVRDTCHEFGALFTLDEMITGFRWHNGGAQAHFGVEADLATLGKGIGNGFAVSALIGKREFMKRGGIKHTDERVFLLSTTHGAETHALAAANATMKIYRDEDVIGRMFQQGEKLRRGITEVVRSLKLEGYFGILGKAPNLVYATKDQDGQPSQPFRTLFLQETIRRGLIAPSLVVSYSHSDEDVERTISAVSEALEIYRKALDEGVDKYLQGRPVQPVFRKFANS